MKCISIDCGSSYTKFYNGNKLTEQPTFIYELHAQGKIDCPLWVSVDNKAYAYGNTALNYASVKPYHVEYNSDFHGSERQHIMMCGIFETIGINNSYDLLIRSVPYDHRNNAELREKLSQERKFAWKNHLSEDCAVEFAAVRVVAQGVGAHYQYLQTHKNFTGQSICVADIGSCSLDVIVSQRDMSGNYGFSEHCMSRRGEGVSVQWFKNRLVQLITANKKSHGEYGYHDMMSVVASGNHTLFERSAVDIAPEIAQVRQEFSRHIRDSIVGMMGLDRYVRLSAVLLTGGGANLIDSSIFNDAQAVEILDAHSTVIGQYNLLAGD